MQGVQTNLSEVELQKQWSPKDEAKMPFSELMEGDGQAGQDNTAWNKQSTDPKGNQGVE